jgi:hypothetical protein
MSFIATVSAFSQNLKILARQKVSFDKLFNRIAPKCHLVPATLQAKCITTVGTIVAQGFPSATIARSQRLNVTS